MGDPNFNFEDDFEKHFNDSSAGEFMMVNSLTRIARDLERILLSLLACAGLLGIIAFVVTLRLFLGR